MEEILTSLQDAGVRLLFRANIHQKFAVIDQKIVWYGSINLLSYGSAQESIMRLESPNIAQELMKDLGKSISAMTDEIDAMQNAHAAPRVSFFLPREGPLLFFLRRVPSLAEGPACRPASF